MSRIGLFLPSLVGGGVQRCMLALSKGLRDRGRSVDLIVVQGKGPFLSLIPEGVTLIDLRAPRASLALPRLVTYLREARPDAMLSAQTHINAVAILARRLAGVKTRLVISERNHLTEHARHATSLKERLRPLAVWLLYSHADQIVAVSRSVAESIAVLDRRKFGNLRVIYNPIDLESLQTQASAPVDHPWLRDSQVPVLLAVGRLAKQKDFPTLLRAFALFRRNRSARLIILGEGDERGPLTDIVHELGIAEDVSMPGFTANPYSHMERADLFVLSSAWEGFANVLVESLACGTRIVSTDCAGGPSEILEHGRFGRMTPVGDAEALADAMLKTLVEPIQSERLKARAREFALDRIVPQYLDVLQS